MAKTIDESWYVRPDGLPEGRSAGGVVVRLEDGRAMIALAQEREFDEYVLPKGGIESGEDVEEAARREIEEEVGVSDLRLVADLGELERLSYSRLEWKRTHYFLFTTDQVEATPTDIERHDRMAWFPLDELPDMFWREQRALLEENKERILKSLTLHG